VTVSLRVLMPGAGVVFHCASANVLENLKCVWLYQCYRQRRDSLWINFRSLKMLFAGAALCPLYVAWAASVERACIDTRCVSLKLGPKPNLLGQRVLLSFGSGYSLASAVALPAESSMHIAKGARWLRAANPNGCVDLTNPR
jgi:hypothetical protein